MAGVLAAVMMCVLTLGSGGDAGADAQSDLDYYRRQYDDLKSQYDRLEGDSDRYLEHSKSLRAFDVEELDKLIKAMCGLDVERSGDDPDQLNKEMTAKAVQTVRDNYEATEDEWEKLDYRNEHLQDDLESVGRSVESISTEDELVKTARDALLDEISKTYDRTTRLHEKVKADLQSLTNVKEGTMNGANNPRIKAALEYGKLKHVEMQAYRYCHERETVLSSGGRPDCVLFIKDDCRVIEFKPDRVGESAARSEAAAYVPEVVKYFTDKNDPRLGECKKDSNNVPIFEAYGETYPACS